MSDDMPRTTSVSDGEILDAFSAPESPVATVSDIEQHVPLEADSIRHRLKQLEERGAVKSKKVGARAVVWWRLND